MSKGRLLFVSVSMLRLSVASWALCSDFFIFRAFPLFSLFIILPRDMLFSLPGSSGTQTVQKLGGELAKLAAIISPLNGSPHLWWHQRGWSEDSSSESLRTRQSWHQAVVANCGLARKVWEEPDWYSDSMWKRTELSGLIQSYDYYFNQLLTWIWHPCPHLIPKVILFFSKKKRRNFPFLHGGDNK